MLQVTKGRVEASEVEALYYKVKNVDLGCKPELILELFQSCCEIQLVV